MPARLTGRAVLTLLGAFAIALAGTYWATSAGGSDEPQRVRPLGSRAVPLDLTAQKGPPLALGAASSLPALARAPQRPRQASRRAAPEPAPSPAPPASAPASEPVQNPAPAPSPPPEPAPVAPTPAPEPAPAPAPKPPPQQPSVDFDDSG